jgi:hypothetical protein
LSRITSGAAASLEGDDHALVASQWWFTINGELKNHVNRLSARRIGRHNQISVREGSAYRWLPADWRWTI